MSKPLSSTPDFPVPPVSQPDLVVPQHLTSVERAMFEALGLRPGIDPVPANMSEIVTAVAPMCLEETSSGLLPSESVPVVRLTPEQKQEILKQLHQTRKQAEKSGAGLLLGNYAPSVAEYLQQAQTRTSSEDYSSSPVVSESEAQTSSHTSSASAAQTATNQAASAAAPSAEAHTGEQSALKQCPCCGWDLNKLELVPVTEEDKTQFVAYWLGGHPFQKTYTLLNKRISVTFRELSESDKIEIHRQLGRDIDQKKHPKHQLLGALEASLARYQFALQLVEFSAEGSLPIHLPRSLEEWERARREANDQSSTTLEFAEKYVFGKLVKYETIKVALYRKAAQFNDLAARLAILQETDPESF